MQLTDQDCVLVTGATGLVGSHVAERMAGKGIKTRVLARASSNKSFLQTLPVEICDGDICNPESLEAACAGVTVIVHCAAKVGDWGPTEPYRAVNVDGLENLLKAAIASGSLQRFVHISSLGVYAARDHHGTDETEQPNTAGIDGYTLTKVESEQLVLKYIKEHNVPGIVLRPGFIYGPRDRTVLPRIMEKLQDGKFAFLGGKDALMNNTYVGNLCDAVLLAIQHDDRIGEVYNIRDARLVSKGEFINTIAREAGCQEPTKVVPLGVARALAKVLETTWKLLGKKEAPILSSARIKFLALNLDYSIQKAQHELGYAPAIDFADGMKETIASLKA